LIALVVSVKFGLKCRDPLRGLVVLALKPLNRRIVRSIGPLEDRVDAAAGEVPDMEVRRSRSREVVRGRQST